MILEMKVPSPGESITEVEIAQWLVAEGDYVEKDQPIAEIDSDKATLELPAEESGIITFKAEEGDAVGVGQVVCLIDTEGKPSGDAPVKASDAVQAPAAPAEKEVVTRATYASGSASPAAKKFWLKKELMQTQLLEVVAMEELQKKMLFRRFHQWELSQQTVNEIIHEKNYPCCAKK